MTDKNQLAVVTGANRGIGYEICRQLSQLGIQVLLTSRDEEKGQKACESLREEGFNVLYHQLDMSDSTSIEIFADNVQEVYGHCDILINNAGVFPEAAHLNTIKDPSVLSAEIQTIQDTLLTNSWGPLLLCQDLIPMMQQHNYGRIVNISSGLGQLAEMKGLYPSYRLSKVALNAITRMIADEVKDFNIKVNSMCPGWVKTDMGGPDAVRELSQGAETATWLASLGDDAPTGLFFRDKKVIDW